MAVGDSYEPVSGGGGPVAAPAMYVFEAPNTRTGPEYGVQQPALAQLCVLIPRIGLHVVALPQVSPVATIKNPVPTTPDGGSGRRLLASATGRYGLPSTFVIAQPEALPSLLVSVIVHVMLYR